MTKIIDAIEMRIRELRVGVEGIKYFSECLTEMDALDEKEMVAILVKSIESSVALMFEFEEVDDDMELTGFVAQCNEEMYCAEFYWGDGEDDEFFEMGPVRGGFEDPGYGVILSKAKEILGEDDDAIGLVNDFMWNSFAKLLNLALEKAVLSKKFKKLPLSTPFKVYLCQHDGWGSDLSEESLVFRI